MADSSYPLELLYHPEHDWARIEGAEATLGITWHAQDALGEVVFFEPPPITALPGRGTPRSSSRNGASSSLGPAARVAATASAPMKPPSRRQHHPRPASIGPRSVESSLP